MWIPVSCNCWSGQRDSTQLSKIVFMYFDSLWKHEDVEEKEEYKTWNINSFTHRRTGTTPPPKKKKSKKKKSWKYHTIIPYTGIGTLLLTNTTEKNSLCWMGRPVLKYINYKMKWNETSQNHKQTDKIKQVAVRKSNGFCPNIWTWTFSGGGGGTPTPSYTYGFTNSRLLYWSAQLCQNMERIIMKL